MTSTPHLVREGRRLRVLMVQPALATYRIDLLNALGEICDFKVVFLRDHISYHPSVRQDQLQRQLTCDFSVLHSNVVIRDRDLPAGLFGMILAHRPDVLVTHEYAASSIIGAFAQKMLGCGLVIWSVANPTETINHGVGRAALRRLLAVRADALIVYSRGGSQTFAGRFGLRKSNIFVCANHQMECRLRRLMEAGRADALREIEQRGLGRGPLVLYVGRLASEKCVAVALRAFAEAVQAHPELTFVVIGDGPEECILRQTACELGVAKHVIFLGHREGATLYGWYAAASLLVLPSAFEPYGAVIAEALSLGVPVLCSRLAGASELVVEGKNGWLCEPSRASVRSSLTASSVFWRPALELLITERLSLCGDLFTDTVNNFANALQYASEQQGYNSAV